MITGIILAGGKSTRMGTEKGLISLNGKRLIEYAAEVLESVCDTIIISTNSDQYNYLDFEKVPDLINGIGPISGIYSCLKKSRTEFNIVLSCDMPFVRKDLLDYLVKQTPGYKAAVPWAGRDHFEPLCACYNISFLPDLEKFIGTGNSRLPDLLSGSNINKLVFGEEHSLFSKYMFLNINSPDDLKMAEEILAME